MKDDVMQFLTVQLHRTFTGDWHCENPEEPGEQWIFTDGERRQKPVPRDPELPLTLKNLMFRELRPWSRIMSERINSSGPSIIDTLEADLDKAMLEPFGEVSHEA